MRRVSRGIALALMAASLALLAAGVALKVTAGEGDSGTPALLVDATAKSFGTGRAKKRATVPFTFTNRSAGTLHLIGGAVG